MTPTNSLHQRIRQIKHVVLDMDGTIYLDEQLFQETKPFLKTLGVLGVGYSFITNNNSRSRAEYLAVLERRGLSSPAEAMVTSTLPRRIWKRTFRRFAGRSC